MLWALELRLVRYFKIQILEFAKYSKWLIQNQILPEQLFISYSTFQAILCFFISKWNHSISKNYRINRLFAQEQITGRIAEFYSIIGSKHMSSAFEDHDLADLFVGLADFESF